MSRDNTTEVQIAINTVNFILAGVLRKSSEVILFCTSAFCAATITHIPKKSLIIHTLSSILPAEL